MNKELDIEFRKAYEIASKMSEKLPQDVMLKFYAYYKQATNGDNTPYHLNSGVRDAFKLNAWMQLRGVSCGEAKKKYIELVKKHTK
jgi:diazepam-binding inhibitor (GABA receptor modulator, acyl-CoA-binding protein)